MTTYSDYWASVEALNQIHPTYRLEQDRAEKTRGQVLAQVQRKYEASRQRAQALRTTAVNALTEGHTILLKVDESQRLPERVRAAPGAPVEPSQGHEQQIGHEMEGLRQAAKALGDHRSASRERRSEEADAREKRAIAARQAEEERRRHEEQERIDRERRLIRKHAQRVSVGLWLAISIVAIAIAAASGLAAIAIVGALGGAAAGLVAWNSLSSKSPATGGAAQVSTTSTRTKR